MWGKLKRIESLNLHPLNLILGAMLLYALNSSGQRIEPSKNYKGAVCPCCDSPVIAKCGDYNIWHWAHENLEDCDTWSEAEGPWHRDWKKYFPSNTHEVVCGENREHRADIKTKNGLVIELQQSPIHPEIVAEREDFYGKMIWVFNSEDRAKRCMVKCHIGEFPRHFDSFKQEDKNATLGEIGDLTSSWVEFQKDPRKFLTPIAEAPFSSKMEWRQHEISKKQTAVLEAKEKIQHWESRQVEDPTKAERFIKNWEEKLTKREADLEANKLSDHYLKIPIPDTSEPEKIDFLENKKIKGQKIYFRWKKSAKGPLKCSKPVVWDTGSSEKLIYFPLGLANFDPRKIIGYVVVRKTLIEHLQKL